MSEEQGTNQETNQEQAQNQEQTPDEFSLPEEYKEAGWAKSIPAEVKTKDEFIGWVTKQYDNQNKVVGAKLEDLATKENMIKMPETEEDFRNIANKFIPENSKDYDIAGVFKDSGMEISEKGIESYSNLFKKENITKKQATNIAKRHIESEIENHKENTTLEGFDEKVNEVIGKEKVLSAQALIKSTSPKELAELWMPGAFPNDFLKCFYEVFSNAFEKMDYKETSSKAQNMGNGSMEGVTGAEAQRLYDEKMKVYMAGGLSESASKAMHEELLNLKAKTMKGAK